MLKRSLSLALLSFYGLGTILGAGIYALIGNVVQNAGMFTPLSFLIASFIAFFTAISYAEFASRYPHSAGSALYMRVAFKRAWFSGLIGWLVVLTGVVSAGTMAHGFVKYFQVFLPLHSWLIIAGLIVVLGSLAIWGIYESVTSIMWMTIIEVSGLLLVIFFGRAGLYKSVTHWYEWFPTSHATAWSGILLGSFIAFYAFIGFEDMVNTAEETLKPQTTLPYAIFIALAVATLLYLVIALVTVFTLSPSELRSGLPLAQILQKQNVSPLVIALIALISIMNGIIVQIIMASRLIYGMAKQQNAPRFFSIVDKRTQTPILATLFVMIAIMVLAFFFPIETLAKATSTIILCIFIIIHIALIKVKLTTKAARGAMTFPIFFPITGALAASSFLILQIFI